MLHRKIRLGILCGGRSAEHEVSLISAKNIIGALDRDKYELFLIGIDKNGEWKLREEGNFLSHSEHPDLVHLQESVGSVALVPKDQRKEIVSFEKNQLGESLSLDVVFPILHGTYGEDGTVQGLLKLANIPFVGASVLGSAIGMDKDVAKRLLRDANIPVAPFVVMHRHLRDRYVFEDLVKELGLPFFVKPANLGSSIGVSKVKSRAEFETALEEAFSYDSKGVG